jgi:hypothetical protein
MSILSKLANLNKATNTTSRQEMTPLQMEQCKEALRRDNRGYNVQPNKFDLAQPYRVAINYENKWHNFGNFTNVNVAAAIGTIVSVAFFGDKAKAGIYDQAIAEVDAEFIAWIADPRNADVIAKANGDSASVHDGGAIASPTTSTEVADNPF